MTRLSDTLLGMLTLLSVALSLALVSRLPRETPLPLLQAYYGSVPEGVEVATPAAAFTYFQKGGALFVDAREKERYRTAHIPGALNFPVDDFQEHRASLSALRTSHAVIVYCEDTNCGASIKLATLLQESGVNDLVLMPEGIHGWLDEGYPVLGSDDG